MSTPTLNAGENPAADAAAAEHVRMLLSTGMAYEFQPETIATRAFLDGFALGANELHFWKYEIRTNEEIAANLNWLAAEGQKHDEAFDYTRFMECVNQFRVQNQMQSAELTRVKADRMEWRQSLIDSQKQLTTTTRELAQKSAALILTNELRKRAVELLVWCVAQFQGESGAGESYWEQFPEYQAACKIVDAARRAGILEGKG